MHLSSTAYISANSAPALCASLRTSTSRDRVALRQPCALYLLRLVGVGERDHHPDDVEVVEGGAGGEGAGQHGRLAAGRLDAALGHGHVQRPHAHCGTGRGGDQRLDTRRGERGR